MTQALPPATEPEVLSEEQARSDATIESALMNVMEKRDEKNLERMVDAIHKLAEPQWEKGIDFSPPKAPAAPERVPAMSAARIVSPYSGLYRKLPEAMQAYRSPDADHWSQQWMLGLAHRDRGVMALAHEKIEGLGYERAIWDVGAQTGISFAGEAGELVPIPLAGVIMIERDLRAKIPGLSSSFEMTSNAGRIPTVGAASAEMVLEGATAGDNEPAVAEKVYRANKMQSMMAATLELLNDSPFNTISILGARAGAAMGALEDDQICTSAGTAPNISEKILGTVITAISAADPTYADVVAIYFTLAQPYRPTAVWYAAPNVVPVLTLLADGQGRPIFYGVGERPGAVTDDNNTDGFMLRKPVYEVPLPDGMLMFAARETYGFGRRQGLTAAASTDAGWATDSVEFKFTQRVDGLVLDVAGICQQLGWDETAP